MINKYFIHHDFYHLKSTTDFILLEQFQTVQQTTEYTCGPACAKMVLHYFGNFDYTELQIAQLMGTKPDTGTKLKSIVRFFKKAGFKVESTLEFNKRSNLCFETFKAFKQYILRQLKNKNTVIVENVDYGGHYKVIIGYDQVSDNEKQDVLIFADPYDASDGLVDGYNYFPAERFFSMWFDYNCLDKNEKIQPFVTVFHPNLTELDNAIKKANLH